jgi:cation/acetate symporter
MYKLGTLGMMINISIALLVSRFTPAPPASVQEIVEDIRIPRGAKEAIKH